MSSPNLKVYIGRYDFKRKVCNHCKVKGCISSTFCYELHSESREAYERVFKYMNTHHVSFNILPITDKMDAICRNCMFRGECFVDNMRYACMRKLRVQFGSRQTYSMFGFGTTTRKYDIKPKLMLYGDNTLKLLLEQKYDYE